MEPAKNLRVRVLNNGEEKVFVTLPIYSLKIISSVMPEGVLKQISKRDINLDEIVAQVKASDYRPQTLFEEDVKVDGVQKTYKVWID